MIRLLSAAVCTVTEASLSLELSMAFIRNQINKRKGVFIMDMKLEVVVIPVSDVDRAKRFYEKLGFAWTSTTSPTRTTG
jgi:hypothetical protein